MSMSCKIAILAVLLLLNGCASLLPSSSVTIESPWKDYDSAKASYEKIIPWVTTQEDLKKIGYDPRKMSNIKIMNATEVASVFMPNPSIKIEDLDLGIQKCIESKDRCTAYQIVPSILKTKRIGNFWLDMFTFKRHTENSGWEFRGLITIVDNVVTYRDPPGGRPLIHTFQVEVKPLGPLQEIGGLVTSVLSSFLP